MSKVIVHQVNRQDMAISAHRHHLTRRILPKPTKIHIGGVLYILRTNDNLSQDQAAARANIASATWHLIEKKGKMPQYKHLIEIADALSILPLTILLLAFNAISIEEQDSSESLVLSYHHFETIYNGELTEENYLEIRRMMGRDRVLS